MRADKFFAERFGSRTKAAEAIEKELVLKNGKPIRPKDEVTGEEEFSFLEPEESFVSNGGYKLSRAIKAFNFSCKDKVFADIGASTGGFSDCLLQNGAKKIYAIDVGESLLHEKLTGSSSIVKMDNTNARYLTKADFSERIDGVTVDVSFISLKLILPAIKQILSEEGDGLLLIKPQFECEKKNIGKSGIVHPSSHPKIVKGIVDACLEVGLYPIEIINAPVRKGKNIEYILHVKPTGLNSFFVSTIETSVKEFVKLNSLNELK